MKCLVDYDEANIRPFKNVKFFLYLEFCKLVCGNHFRKSRLCVYMCVCGGGGGGERPKGLIRYIIF